MAQETENSIMDRLASKIDEYGWTVVSVFADPEAGHPPFTYSIGFTETFDAPEVVLLGIPPETAQSIIAGMAHGLRNREIRIPDKETRMSHVIRNFDVQIRIIPEDLAGNIARCARARYTPAPVRLRQVVLPDPRGLFPGEEGCDPVYGSMQDIIVFEE